jgi:hypothetical protein
MDTDAAQQLLREVVDWRPDGGVVSAYVSIDPGDRGEGWRIELKNQLAACDDGVAERVMRRFADEGPLPHGRTQVGFLELDGARRERWNGFQMADGPTRVVQGPSPHLEPLVRIVDDGWPLGIVVVALESVRVLEWGLGEVSELDGWELEITSLDWHERKSQRVNPATGTGASASGRDQYGQRLEHNRERFLKEAGQLVASRYGDRVWRQLVIFGEGDRPALLARGLGGHLRERVHEVPQDLIRARASEVGARIEEELEHLNRLREEALVAKIEEAISATPSPALGPDEVLRALEQARAHHVIFDSTRNWESREGMPIPELFIRRALATGADVTPAEGLAAAALGAREGAAALLRY